VFIGCKALLNAQLIGIPKGGDHFLKVSNFRVSLKRRSLMIIEERVLLKSRKCEFNTFMWKRIGIGFTHFSNLSLPGLDCKMLIWKESILPISHCSSVGRELGFRKVIDRYFSVVNIVPFLLK